MNETWLLIAALAGVMVIIVIYIVVKDKDVQRKIIMMESGIDALNQELFKISKEFDRLKNEIVKTDLSKVDNMQIVSEESISPIINHKLKPFALQLEYLQEKVDRIDTEFKADMQQLSSKFRQITFANEHCAPDEQKILRLHESGMGAEDIAKHLRLGKGEVELVLKFSKIHA